jgi:hypothetical protein
MFNRHRPPPPTRRALNSCCQEVLVIAGQFALRQRLASTGLMQLT